MNMVCRFFPYFPSHPLVRTVCALIAAPSSKVNPTQSIKKMSVCVNLPIYLARSCLITKLYHERLANKKISLARNCLITKLPYQTALSKGCLL
uniref:Uncharacterized protein n=1 Tax=Picea glauca TaxID=3330 RepID=A0A101LVI6_PICGL|nr:hypothetical protein ABT39_MTgene1945 [Picea glauca]